MNPSEPIERSHQVRRWSRMWAQAAHLAHGGHTLDAVAQTRECLAEVREAIEATTDPALGSALGGFLERAERSLADAQKAHDAWRHDVADRQRRYWEREQAIYEEPLPLPRLE